MAKKLNRILVIDVESTCWEKGKEPPGMVHEIIEVGQVLFDTHTLENIEEINYKIKPQNSLISEYCTNLTGITPKEWETVTNTFEDYIVFIENKYKNITWASYGDYDRIVMQKMCTLYRCGYPFNSSHINIKNIFSLKRGLKKEVGRPTALKMLGLIQDGREHRALPDAMSIAEILKKTLFSSS